ncbi:MAG: phosphoribosylaminoimidazolesuccinocarboxamide synthase [Gammaproteobacteria bacterium WSBS_2016_MAG_OTU1]
MSGLLQSELRSLPLVGRGKVRDMYAVGDDRLLIVQSDRISAFDVIMNEPVPQKGAVLTAMSFFWFDKLAHIVKNHLLPETPESVVADDEKSQIASRTMLVKKYKPLPIEAVCRGYLIGSGWKDYQKTGSVCGVELPPNLKLAAKLPETIFTPATKAEQGEHDENISFAQMANIVGEETAARVRDATLNLYAAAAEYAKARGIIIADTKFEFALDDDGELVLIDEALTPDSSRFWRDDTWQEGQNPESFDKQIVRDWLETQVWDKSPPPPTIPEEILQRTSDRYMEIRDKLLEG